MRALLQATRSQKPDSWIDYAEAEEVRAAIDGRDR